MTDDITKATMIALLARWQNAWALQHLQTAIRDEASKKITEFGKTISDCKMLAKTLGFDRESDRWGDITAEFVPAAVELYNRAREPGMPDWNWRPPPTTVPLPLPLPPPPPPPMFNSQESSQDEDDIVVELDQNLADEGEALTTTVREAVINALKHVGPWGAKASQLRLDYEQQHGTKLHDKTIGMTLYRLSKETPPLVRREGRTWFFAEAKNPGVGAPGNIEDLQ